ncbi:MAG: GGDEF domain-containing protein [Erysipelotrichaceae bacterium]
MKKRMRSWLTPIPRNLREEFQQEITQINLRRLIGISIALFFIALVLLAFEDSFFNIGPVIFAFLIASLLQIPLFFVTFRYRLKIKRSLVQAQTLVYLLSVILFGIHLSLLLHAKTDLVPLFLMMNLALAAILYLDIQTSLLVFTFAAVLFTFLLPSFQSEATLVLITRINALIFILMAWLLNRMIYRMKVDGFVLEKELKEKDRILTEMNQRDPLTGLDNHTSSFRKLYEETAKAKRIGYPISLILCDIDDFKHINDTFGHQAGDHVLLRISQTIRATLRTTDIVGRYGGEEFILILPDTDVDAARVLSERLSQAMTKTTYDVDVIVTMSGGICQYDAGQSIDEWIRTTDRRLYEAKHSGKNRFESGTHLHQLT